MPMPGVNRGLLRVFVGLVLNGYFARLDMNNAGTAGLTYASYFTGTIGNTNLSKLFLDPSGQVVFCGSTLSDIPLTPNALQGFGGVASSRLTTRDFASWDACISR